MNERTPSGLTPDPPGPHDSPQPPTPELRDGDREPEHAAGEPGPRDGPTAPEPLTPDLPPAVQAPDPDIPPGHSDAASLHGSAETDACSEPPD